MEFCEFATPPPPAKASRRGADIRTNRIRVAESAIEEVEDKDTAIWSESFDSPDRERGSVCLIGHLFLTFGVGHCSLDWSIFPVLSCGVCPGYRIPCDRSFSIAFRRWGFWSFLGLLRFSSFWPSFCFISSSRRRFRPASSGCVFGLGDSFLRSVLSLCCSALSCACTWAPSGTRTACAVISGPREAAGDRAPLMVLGRPTKLSVFGSGGDMYSGLLRIDDE